MAPVADEQVHGEISPLQQALRTLSSRSAPVRINHCFRLQKKLLNSLIPAVCMSSFTQCCGSHWSTWDCMGLKVPCLPTPCRSTAIPQPTPYSPPHLHEHLQPLHILYTSAYRWEPLHIGLDPPQLPQNS